MMTLSAEIIPEGSHELAQVQRTTSWLEAFELWQAAQSPNTAKAYKQAVRDLLAVTEKAPWDIHRQDVQRWVDSMRRRELAASTIRLRVAGVASYYTFCRDEFGLVEINPAESKSLRPAVSAYKNARWLDADEVRALIEAIPQDNPTGLQDLAWVIFILYTGRRNSEVRNLKWGDLQKRGGSWMYRWSGKGKGRTDVLPEPVYDALLRYLFAAGRVPLADEDYIFTPLSDRAANLPNVDAKTWRRDKPLSIKELNRRLRVHAQRAGLRVDGLHVHSLRHTAAMLRKTVGDPLDGISSFLNHSSLAVTQIYLHHMTDRQDTSWHLVRDLIGG